MMKRPRTSRSEPSLLMTHLEGDGFEPSVPRQKDNAFGDSSFSVIPSKYLSRFAKKCQIPIEPPVSAG
jgi:hypothetical protein